KAGRDGPGIFMKQPGTVIGPDDSIIYPRIGVRIIHEAEVGIVIGRQARHVSVENALDYVLGYTCVNDVSANELTNNDVGAGMSLRWKHFDTFCPLGPVVATDIDGDNLRVQCRVNGKTDVDGNSADMLWGVAELVSWVSDVMTLYPGDIIPSGCPGVDEINIGDTVEVEVEGIGVLRNPVVADSD
ncbi:MAG: fumarylacetoacetate hydrolase family protein, partial [Rhodospirillaceae bacterium]|nr:fumarylacetoacetate hydrolase family protein [Rhodospirillaceae bacterium]